MGFDNVPDGTIVVFEMGWATQPVEVIDGRACATFDIEAYGVYTGTATVETDGGKAVHEWEIEVDELEQSCALP